MVEIAKGNGSMVDISRQTSLLQFSCIKEKTISAISDKKVGNHYYRRCILVKQRRHHQEPV